MHPGAEAKIVGGNVTRNLAAKGRDWTTAARQWARDAGQRVQVGVKKAGYQTEAYVRDHPGRFIAAACGVGLAAGFFLGRASRRKR